MKSSNEMKAFKDLDLSNGFLFSAAMADPETCQMVLEVILGRPVGELHVHAEQTLLFNSDYKSVRLDVYADEDGALEIRHDVEMENNHRANLPKRVRLYQAQMDITGLKPGEDYDALKPTYIIFICTFDPFGEDCCRYTLEKKWHETGNSYDDGANVIFLNTKGTNRDQVPEVLVHFLEYVDHSTDEVADQTQDATIRKLHQRITQLKQDRGLEGRYMTMMDLLKESREDGREEGRAEGVTLKLHHVIRNMILDQAPNHVILKYTGCTQEDIDTVKADMAQELEMV